MSAQHVGKFHRCGCFEADFSDSDCSESDFTVSINMSLCKFDGYTVWPDSSNLPDDFDSEYVADSIEEDDDVPSGDYY